MGNIALEDREGSLVICLSGEVGLGDAEELRNALLSALNAGREVRVELAGATEIGLAPVQILISASRTFASREIAFELADSPEGVWAATLFAEGIPYPAGGGL